MADEQAPFNPEEYLAAKSAIAEKSAANPNVDQLQVSQFNPEAYLASKTIENHAQGQEEFGTSSELLKTAAEQGLSGLTLGGSKVLETQGIPALGIPAITTPERVAARERANPNLSTVSNILGTGALIGLTGGAGGLLAEGAGTAARVGAGALEGATIGGVTQATDDWSQNKSLDAQKIVASAGLGSLLGGAGGFLSKGAPLTKVSQGIEDSALKAEQTAANASAAPVSVAEEFKGVKPTSFEEIVDRVNKAKEAGAAEPLPALTELDDALSRVGLENPVNPLQRNSLGSQEARDIYQTAKETPGEVGPVISNYEGAQKAELVKKTEESIKNISPGIEPISDAYEAGQKAIEAFGDQYQAEKEALKPIFKAFKELPIGENILPQAIGKMTDAVPGVANMFDTSRATLALRPYKTSWGIDKATYNAVKEAVHALATDAKSFESIWNVRKGLDQHIDVLAKGQAPAEIRALKSSLMDLMQEATGNPQIRDAFKRYAINEQQRNVIEKTFGASVGSPEFEQISKVNPEKILNKMFSQTANVEAAKNILPEAQFKNMLANFISKAKEDATDKGFFSSNKFGRFLKQKQDVLNIAFADNPTELQRLRDLTTISRILPDAASINPSGTAKTISRMILGNADQLHHISWEGLLAKIPHKIAEKIKEHQQMSVLNQELAGKALKVSQEMALKTRIENTSNRLNKEMALLFSASASQARKSNNGK